MTLARVHYLIWYLFKTGMAMDKLGRNKWPKIGKRRADVFEFDSVTWRKIIKKTVD